MASQMSDHAFALLDTLNKQNSGGSTNPLLPQVATFAGDAQTLSSALGKGDMSAANNAVGILQSDSANTDAAMAAHPGAVDAAQWKALKQQLNEITHQVQLAGGAKPAAATPQILRLRPPLPLRHRHLQLRGRPSLLRRRPRQAPVPRPRPMDQRPKSLSNREPAKASTSFV